MPTRERLCECHPYEVWLSPDEVAWADRIGAERYKVNAANRYKDRGGKAEMASHQFGARGELAMSLILGIEWPALVLGPKDTRYRFTDDIGRGIEVRASHGTPDLKVRDTDMVAPRCDRFFVSLAHRSVLDTWRWVGWVHGSELAGMALRAEQRRADLAPAYWVPPSLLHPPDAMPS
jgi:hypothetical protein